MIKPLGKKVVVQLEEPESVTTGGIIIPDANQNKNTAFAKVLSLGQDGGFEFKEGDRVIIDKYAGDNIKIDGKNCLVIQEFNVFGVIQ